MVQTVGRRTRMADVRTDSTDRGSSRRTQAVAAHRMDADWIFATFDCGIGGVNADARRRRRTGSLLSAVDTDDYRSWRSLFALPPSYRC